MNENEMIEFEGRQYVNPDISRDEQMAFIDTMRDMQAQNNAQIATETHNLGTDVEPIRGGLSGSEEYWKGVYQAPQTEAAVANMKAVAQQTALNNALTNYQNALQNRYNQAYRNYQKRAYLRSLNSGGGGGGVTGDVTTEGGTEYEDAGEDEVTIDEQEINVAKPTSTDTGAINAANQYGSVTGASSLPTTTTHTGYIITPGGQNVSYRFVSSPNGKGLELAEGYSYTEKGSLDYLQKVVSNGGRIYNHQGKDISGWYRIIFGI